MSGFGVLAHFDFLEDDQEKIERFFYDGREIVDSRQPATTAWFAFRVSSTTYGAFAWFATEEDREALLAAGGPKSSRANADLFVRPPTFESVEVVADRQCKG